MKFATVVRATVVPLIPCPGFNVAYDYFLIATRYAKGILASM